MPQPYSNYPSSGPGYPQNSGFGGGYPQYPSQQGYPSGGNTGFAGYPSGPASGFPSTQGYPATSTSYPNYSSGVTTESS